MANVALARTVSCPDCGAIPGDRCYTRGIIGGRMEQVHADRLRKAIHAQQQEATLDFWQWLETQHIPLTNGEARDLAHRAWLAGAAYTKKNLEAEHG